MKKCKRALGIMLVSLLVISSISLVSAGFKDFFGFGEDSDLEGELAESRFDAVVDLSGASPTIVAFRTVTDLQSDGSTPIGTSDNGEVQPLPYDFVYARVIFIIEDPDGAGNIPGDVGDGAVAISEGATDSIPGGENLNVQIIIPADLGGVSASVAYREVEVGKCFATQCADGTNTNCNAATALTQGDGNNFALQKQYTCDVKMEYFDSPSLGSLPGGIDDELWNIQVWVEDAEGLTDTVSSGTTNHKGYYDFDGVICTGALELGDCDYVSYLTTSAIDTTAGGISWSELTVTAEDTPGDGPLILKNWGNTPVASVDLTGQNLTGVNIGASSIMEVEAFSAGISQGAADSGACGTLSGGGSGGVELKGNEIVNVDRTVPYTAIGEADEEDLYFCVWAAIDPTYLDGPLDSSYSATVIKNNNWDVVFNS